MRSKEYSGDVNEGLELHEYEKDADQLKNKVEFIEDENGRSIPIVKSDFRYAVYGIKKDGRGEEYYLSLNHDYRRVYWSERKQFNPDKAVAEKLKDIGRLFNKNEVVCIGDLVRVNWTLKDTSVVDRLKAELEKDGLGFVYKCGESWNKFDNEDDVDYEVTFLVFDKNDLEMLKK